MRASSPHYDLAVLSPTSDVRDEIRLAQLLFALSLSRRVIIAPKDLREIKAWESCRYLDPYCDGALGQWSVETNRESTVQEMLASKSVVIGADDRLSGLSERLGMLFLFVPTITNLPSPRGSPSVQRLAIVGPECSGKSTLAKDLAKALDTIFVPEYSRLMLEFRGTPCEESDLEAIILGQIALEESLAVFANQVLICDTEPRLSKIWSTILYHQFPAAYESWIDRDYAGYLLTKPDLPWASDLVRCLPEGGLTFFTACEQMFSGTGRPVTVISGLGDERLSLARLSFESSL
jgi:nicotinamide riboside kinase